MDPEKLREYLETRCEFDKTRGKLIEKASKRVVSAIVPVHLYGQTADMDRFWTSPANTTCCD